jgi:hypothetical protein
MRSLRLSSLWLTSTSIRISSAVTVLEILVAETDFGFAPLFGGRKVILHLYSYLLTSIYLSVALDQRMMKMMIDYYAMGIRDE